MTRLAAALLIAALTSGCASTRYVTVRCISPEQLEQLRKSEPPKVGDRLTGRADEDVKIVAGSAIRLRAYAHGLLGVIEGCQDSPDRK